MVVGWRKGRELGRAEKIVLVSFCGAGGWILQIVSSVPRDILLADPEGKTRATRKELRTQRSGCEKIRGAEPPGMPSTTVPPLAPRRWGNYPKHADPGTARKCTYIAAYCGPPIAELELRYQLAGFSGYQLAKTLI